LISPGISIDWRFQRELKKLSGRVCAKDGIMYLVIMKSGTRSSRSWALVTIGIKLECIDRSNFDE
jgi:hypothetical protein